jgi:cyclopropane-fatty-acyl-phospholipid synthase
MRVLGTWSKNLEQAQEDKLDLVCQKLNLQPGQHILDIGCGWGSFAKYAAENYGVSVVGITISKEQVVLAKENCSGLPIDILLMDYRDLSTEFPKAFDHVISIGMFEHVGPKNFSTYMDAVRKVLKPQGLFLLHTIGGEGADPWIEKHIFPGGWLPNEVQIMKAIKHKFVLEDWHNFGTDYDRTLCEWDKNFVNAWPELKATGKYDERFYRMWRFYLGVSAGAFRARATNLWQFVLSPHGVSGGYRSIR